MIYLLACNLQGASTSLSPHTAPLLEVLLYMLGNRSSAEEFKPKWPDSLCSVLNEGSQTPVAAGPRKEERHTKLGSGGLGGCLRTPAQKW